MVKRDSMVIGYVQGKKNSVEARKVTRVSGRATYFEFNRDDMIDGRELIPILRRGAHTWNKWRAQNRKILPYFGSENLETLFRDGFQDFCNYNLANVSFVGAHLREIAFRGANLRNVDAKSAVIEHCDFAGAKLNCANFFSANLTFCNFRNADLQRVFLVRALLRHTEFVDSDVSESEFGETDFVATTFKRVTGLRTCRHLAPSQIDIATLSERLPTSFLQGVGLSNLAIENRKRLRRDHTVKYLSCFISFSVKDQRFADKLHRDLQGQGVRCWFAPHDLQVGANTLDEIDKQIGKLDRIVIVLSANSLLSAWVEDEVSKAFAEERRRKGSILIPIRLDDEVMHTREAWAAKLRDQRNIGNFVEWRRQPNYKRALRKLVGALTQR